MSTEVMTIEEIKSRFDGEWVLIGDPDVSEAEDVLAGRVLFHSKSRDELYRKALELRPRNSAVLYIGDLPRDLAYVL